MDYLKHQLEIQGIHSKIGLKDLNSIFNGINSTYNYKKIDSVQNYDNYDLLKSYELLLTKKQEINSLPIANYLEKKDFKDELIVGS